jgi:SPP1 family predicted phage head-tail adaptor
MPVDPGKLNKYVTIQRRVPSQDPESGEETWDFVDVFDAWGSVMPLTGKEFWAPTQGEVASATHRWRIRYRNDVDATMRLTYKRSVADPVRYFDIKAVLNPYESDEFLDLITEELIDWEQRPG